MTMVPPPNPGNAPFGSYSAGPPPGLARSAEDNGTLEVRARNALILGMLGLFPLSVLTGVPAIIVGTRALRRIDASEGELTGRRIAWCGIVLGWLSIVLLAGLLYRTYR